MISSLTAFRMVADSGIIWTLHFSAKGITLWLRTWDLISNQSQKKIRAPTGTAMANNGNIVDNLKYCSAWCNFLCVELERANFFLQLHMFQRVHHSEVSVRSKRKLLQTSVLGLSRRGCSAHAIA
jgi:hypothetical protein